MSRTTFEKLVELGTTGKVLLDTKVNKTEEVSIHVAKDGYNKTYFMTVADENNGSNNSISEELAMKIIEHDGDK